MLVKIYEAPAELPDTALNGRLSHYSRILSFRRDLVIDCIENGVHTARMCLHGNIPNLVCIAGELVRIWYPSQPKMCRNCGADDHLAKDCDSMRCFNCEKSGHFAGECPLPIVCSICLDDDHDLGDCPFFLFSANIVPTGNKVPEIQEVARMQAKQERKAKKEQYAKQVKNPTRDPKPRNKDNRAHKVMEEKRDDNRGEASKHGVSEH